MYLIFCVSPCLCGELRTSYERIFTWFDFCVPLRLLLLIHRNALLGDAVSAEKPPFVLSKAVADAKRFMELNYARKLTLSAIAEGTHYHPVHFERLFKRAMGCSPIEYLLELRTSRAKDFLEDSMKWNGNSARIRE